MPKNIRPLILILSLFLCLGASSQKITYSDPEDDDGRQLTAYEVVGKVGGNILIYKNYRDDHYVTAYDPQMKMVAKEKLQKMPERLINSDFINYADQAYMIYQFQKRSTIYCMAQKLDANAKAVGEPVEMDTTHINFWASNRVYNMVVSDDKQRIAVFKVNSRNEKFHILSTTVFDKDLRVLGKDRLAVGMPGRYDYLTEFAIDNKGDIAFLRASSSNMNEDVNQLQMLLKPLNTGLVMEYDVELKNMYLDDLRIRADNTNGRYLVSSFYSKTRRGNVEGIFNFIWDKQKAGVAAQQNISFNDEFRADARGGNSSTKTAFNDYYLRNIVMRQDGGYIVAAESIYTTSRGGNPYSRYDNIYGSPYSGDFIPIGTNPYLYPWYRRSLNQTTRFYADNVVVLSFNNQGALEWSNLVRKSQFDDNTDNYLGYNMINTGSELHFLYNQQEKRTLMLSDQSIDPGGQITRRPTLKNLDKGYDFMPRYGKQVGAKTIIFPCQFRNYICFAKVELN